MILLLTAAFGCSHCVYVCVCVCRGGGGGGNGVFITGFVMQLFVYFLVW